MAAGWKKVLVEDANIQVGTITATLGDLTTDLSASSHAAIELVVSDGGELKTRTADFGTAAFSDASDFQAAGSYLTASDMAKDLVAGTGLTGGADDVLYGTNADVTISLANIADMKVLGNVSGSVAAPTAVAILDEDNMASNSATSLATQQSIKAYVDTEISGISDNDTTYTISTITDGTTGYVGIRITSSGGTTDTVYIDDQAQFSPITVSESNDLISIDIPDSTGVDGITRAMLQHTSSSNVVLGRMGSAGAITQVSVLDQDNMSSDSNTALATQQSIKAYVDAEVSGVSIPTNFLVDDADDSTTGTITAAGFKAPSLTVTPASGSNQAGTGLNIAAGQGTGTGAGGSITFQVADGGTSGSSPNALATALTIADDKSATFAGAVTITGDLQVDGTTTTVNSENVLLEDHFIALNNNAGTPANADSGIVFQRASDAAALGWSQTNSRFALDFTGAAQDDTSIAADAFIAAVVTSEDANYEKNGNIRINGSEIYIYTES